MAIEVFQIIGSSLPSAATSFPPGPLPFPALRGPSSAHGLRLPSSCLLRWRRLLGGGCGDVVHPVWSGSSLCGGGLGQRWKESPGAVRCEGENRRHGLVLAAAWGFNPVSGLQLDRGVGWWLWVVDDLCGDFGICRFQYSAF
ncbi:hypothetical protein QQ045_008900 [Rhodiola kirilowii]